MSVEEVFNKSAQTFDRARRQLIPCFDEFYGMVLNLIPYSAEDQFRVLDLGAGTGLLSLFVANAFPNAALTLIDISDKMLEKARRRFSQIPGRFEFITADYTSDELPEGKDIILSALSIHHLPDSDKQVLFQRLFRALAVPGVFINADQVLGSTPEIETRYQAHWLQEVRRLGISEEDLSAAHERMQEDQMATLEAQLGWLAAAGFQSVNCWYQNNSFVVYAGWKRQVPSSLKAER